MNRLAEQFPNSHFTGIDLSAKAISYARHEAQQKGLSNAVFVVRDLSDFHESAKPETFDFVTTFDAIHD